MSINLMEKEGELKANISNAADDLIKINDSLIQHGSINDRVYVMSLNETKIEQTLRQVEDLAHTHQYSKIFIKSSETIAPQLAERDYICEAHIPGFYQGEVAAHFMAKYLTPERQEEKNEQQIVEIIQTSLEKQQSLLHINNDGMELLVDDLDLRQLGKSDAEEMSEVYKQVFTTYPFPIHDPEYIQQSMDSHVEAYGVFEDEKLVALASCEIDHKGQNVEMTDFATLPSHRGKKMAQKLLAFMEIQMQRAGIRTAYTIARAKSMGMNITFSKHNYIYSGTLVNNTNIAGDIESMNVWYRSLWPA